MLPRDAEQKSNRLSAKLKLTREAIAAGNLTEVTWQLTQSDLRAEAEEAEFWTLVAGFIAQRLESWAASNETLLTNMVQIQLSAVESSLWTIRPAASNSVYAAGGMGGMGLGGMGGGTFGGGMGRAGGGMGQVYTPGLPLGSIALVSESIELLATYSRLPDSLQPRAALEKVRTMLETKNRASKNLTEFFDGEWTGLSWNGEMQLQRYAQDGSLQVLGQDDQSTAAAFVLYRWVDGILESDFLAPGWIVQKFFQQLTSDPSQSTAQSTDGHAPGHWIHSSLRDRWSQADEKSLYSTLADMEQSRFEPNIFNSNTQTATVIGKLVTETGRSNELRVRLGLEREGWRIKSIESFSTGKRELLLPGPQPR